MQATDDALIQRLSFLFMVSGMAALINQIVWQRMLFTFFGVDLESVTLVVAAFMFGLGSGALIGGVLADRSRNPLLLFALLEAGVGLYAWSSPWTISQLGLALEQAGHLTVAVATFLLLLPATLMMGATLPILVTALVRRRPNIGWATGQMYSSNTLGAALGALLAGVFLFLWLGLRQALLLSGLLNLGVAFAVTHLVRREA